MNPRGHREHRVFGKIRQAGGVISFIAEGDSLNFSGPTRAVALI